MRNMKSIATLALLAVSWLLWSGHFGPLMLVFGTASVLFVYWLLGRLGVLEHPAGYLQIILRLPFYVPWLMWQVLLSNIQVAKLIWRPKLQIDPAVRHIPATQKTDLGLVIYANSVTLTPGTLSVDAQSGTVLVHALEASSFDGEDFQTMDARVTALEGK